jgi:hypothetical protein
VITAEKYGISDIQYIPDQKYLIVVRIGVLSLSEDAI